MSRETWHVAVLSVFLGLTVWTPAEATPFSFVQDAGGAPHFELNSIQDTVIRDDEWGLSRAETSADLITGELKIKVETISCLSGPNCANAGLVALTGFGDRITITSPFVGSLDVQLTFSVDGFISNPTYPQLSEFAAVFASARTGSGLFVFDDMGYSLPGEFDRTVTLEFPVMSDQPFFDIFAQISAQAGTPGGFVDMSNTARMGLVLPPGTTWTSDSGVFLSDGPTVVPEPSTMILLGTGLAAAIRSRRRRRHHQV